MVMVVMVITIWSMLVTLLTMILTMDSRTMFVLLKFMTMLMVMNISNWAMNDIPGYLNAKLVQLNCHRV